MLFILLYPNNIYWQKMKFQFPIFHLWVCVTDSPRCPAFAFFGVFGILYYVVSVWQLFESVFWFYSDCLILMRRCTTSDMGCKHMIVHCHENVCVFLSVLFEWSSDHKHHTEKVSRRGAASCGFWGWIGNWSFCHILQSCKDEAFLRSARARVSVDEPSGKSPSCIRHTQMVSLLSGSSCGFLNSTFAWNSSYKVCMNNHLLIASL